MNFASDNTSGASAQIIEAMNRANAGLAASYGADDLTRAMAERFGALFAREVTVHLVASGTAANALALAALVPPWGAVIAHEEAHIGVDECGAPEFFSHGAKIVGLPGIAGKITPAALSRILDPAVQRPPHTVVPRAVSLTQATEAGTVYTPAEISELAAIAHGHGLAVHMDGARFANAVARQGCTPAELSWKAGVDVLSFGGTKNGCVAAEAVVFFDPDRAAEMAVRRKRAGHLLSKHRFFAAQMIALVEDGHWLDLAGTANRAADRLAEGLRARGIELAFPVEANLVFPVFDSELAERLQAAGASFYAWPTRSLGPGMDLVGDRAIYRLVTNFATTRDAVDGFLQCIDQA